MKLLRFPEKIGWRDQIVGALLMIAYAAILLATAKSVGVPRDEGFYFRAASDYARWFQILFSHPAQAVQRGAIDSSWGYNHEHPALMKSLFALSWMFLHEKARLFADASTAFRFPATLMAGASLWVTYLFGARAWSRRAGLVAAASLACFPQVFFNAHLACFDVPIMTMWTLCIYVYWRARDRGGLGWAILAGVVYGLTLETKHNAWILPAVFVPHWLWADRHVIGRQLRVGRLPIPASLVAMAVIGPAVFVLLWPWMWNDTLPRVQEWMNFHLNHEYYNIEFLGRNYFSAPSPKGYVPVMILATVPTITIVLFLIGAVERGREKAVGFLAVVLGALVSLKVMALRPWKERADAVRGPRDRLETDLLFALGLLVAIAPWVRPSTPIFGGTKHWFTAYPFLALFAGRGFEIVAQALERALADRPAAWKTWAPVALAACVLVAPAAVTWHAHPFGLSAYVPLVGGTAGGADMGLNRQFWGYTTQDAAPWLDKNAPRGASVFIHDTAYDSWARMQDEGRVRRDLRAVGSPGEAQIALVQHELHMNEVDYDIWVAFGTDAPAYVVTHDGVPFVSIYAR